MATFYDNSNHFMGYEFPNANSAWVYLYQALNEYGNISSPRGIKVKETMFCDIIIRNPMDNLVYNKLRGLSPIYIAKEYAWYKSGSRKVEDAIKLSKFWGTIANDDGTVNSNYGAYIFVPEEDGKSVWDKTVEILRNDSDSRHGVIQIPIMPARGTKDTPCTSSIQYQIRDNKLNCTVYMRSTDIILGFPIDIFQFTMWQIEMAKELGTELGFMRFISGNIHCYEKNWLENIDCESYLLIDTYNESDVTDKEIVDKCSDEFKQDLVTLASDIPKEEKRDKLNTDILKYMFDNMKIWK